LSARSRAPTCSICFAASSRRYSSSDGWPRSISAIHPRANDPSRIVARTLRMLSRTRSSTTFGPTVCEPYSAVSEIE
jgi:hypothetical protein